MSDATRWAEKLDLWATVDAASIDGYVRVSVREARAIACLLVDLSEQVERKDAALAEAEAKKARLLAVLKRCDKGLRLGGMFAVNALDAVREVLGDVG